MNVGWLLLGCAGEDPSAFERSRLLVCDSACNGFQRCGLADSSCKPSCAETYHPRGIRPSSLTEVAACLGELDCETLDSDEAFERCADRAAKAAPLRAAVLDYCESASKSFFACGSWWSLEDCTESVGLWEDERLNEAKACHSAPCDEIASCEHRVFSGEP